MSIAITSPLDANGNVRISSGGPGSGVVAFINSPLASDPGEYRSVSVGFLSPQHVIVDESSTTGTAIVAPIVQGAVAIREVGTVNTQFVEPQHVIVDSGGGGGGGNVTVVSPLQDGRVLVEAQVSSMPVVQIADGAAVRFDVPQHVVVDNDPVHVGFSEPQHVIIDGGGAGSAVTINGPLQGGAVSVALASDPNVTIQGVPHVIIDSGSSTVSFGTAQPVTIPNGIDISNIPHVVVDSGNISTTQSTSHYSGILQAYDPKVVSYVQQISGTPCVGVTVWAPHFFATNISNSIWTTSSTVVNIPSVPTATWWSAKLSLVGRNNFTSGTLSTAYCRLLEMLYPTSYGVAPGSGIVLPATLPAPVQVTSNLPGIVLDWPAFGNSPSNANYGDNLADSWEGLIYAPPNEASFTLVSSIWGAGGASLGWWSYHVLTLRRVPDPALVAVPN